MFGFIKLLFLLGVIGLGWFSYDFITHLSEQQREALKEDGKELLDSGKLGTFIDSLGSKMGDDFKNRFWPKIMRAFKVLNEDVAPYSETS